MLVSLNIFLSLWYPLHGDLYFHTDIARDFLLLNEIERKKIVLIDTRRDAAGFFHGPLWMYINYPVYFFSNGNSVASGFFWVFLVVILLVSSFFISKKLLNENTAYINILLLSFIPIPFTRDFTHPHMGMLVSPFLFFTLYKYRESLKINYLILNILLTGALIQLEIAIGLPFLSLVFIYSFYLIIKNRK